MSLRFETAKYALLKFQPYANRSEHLNYGLVIFLPNGGVDVKLASSLKKIKAFYPEQDIEALRESADSIKELVGDASLDDALARLNMLRILRNQSFSGLGSFLFHNETEYNRKVERALLSQCETAIIRTTRKEEKSRLFVEVKKQFKIMNILATSTKSIPDHKVVTHFSPDDDSDVTVDFALRNGKLRVAQTMDLRLGQNDDIQKNSRQAAQSKAWALHVTKGIEKEVDSFVIAAGAETSAADRVLSSIKNDGNKIIHWEDRMAMTDFLEEWAEAAGKPLPDIPIGI